MTAAAAAAAETTSEAQAPPFPPFDIDIKIEQSAKGARVTVHCLGYNDDMTITRAINVYKTTHRVLNLQGERVATVLDEDNEKGGWGTAKMVDAFTTSCGAAEYPHGL